MNTLISLPDDILFVILSKLDLRSLGVFFYICRATLSLIRLPHGATFGFSRLSRTRNNNWIIIVGKDLDVVIFYKELVMPIREFIFEGHKITHDSGYTITFAKPYVPLILRTYSERIAQVIDREMVRILLSRRSNILPRISELLRYR